MKKLYGVSILLILLVVTISACNNANTDAASNTIAASDLSDREDGILATTSDQSFVFDFNNDDSAYTEASVWVEKYEGDELVDDKLNKMTNGLDGDGSVIFTTASTKDTESPQFNMGITSGGATGSSNFIDDDFNDSEYISSISGNVTNDQTIREGEIVLANISYISEDSSSMGGSSLSNQFYDDPENHMDELQQYDVTYLLKASFIKE